MAQEIKDLIAKIQEEGVHLAQAHSARIKNDAEKEVLQIIAQAKIQAEKIIEQAKAQAKKTDDSTRAALEQAGRDMLISLKQEIIAMLERLIKMDLRQALTVEELAKIIAGLIKNTPLATDSQIVVSLNPLDKEKLEVGLLKQLISETKKTVVLKSAGTIDSGFIISFDAGKSIFDFSGQALSDYISGCLKPELNKILNAK